MKENDIASLRSFNRFYTSIIGLLDNQYLNSEFSLTEVRIMYELFHSPEEITATGLIDLLGLDKGYLSRMLQIFEKKKLIEKKQSATDKRAFYLYLSQTGKDVFTKLSDVSQQQAVDLLSNLTAKESTALIGHMEAIRNILGKSINKSNEK
jgi:DNA-binding MarR family transcriptional regulator